LYFDVVSSLRIPYSCEHIRDWICHSHIKKLTLFIKTVYVKDLISNQNLPAALLDSGQFSFARQLSETDSAEIELAEIPVISSALPASANDAGGKLRFLVCFYY